MSPEEFREVMLDFLTALERMNEANVALGGYSVAIDAEIARQRFESLTDEELTALYEAFPDSQAFASYVAHIESLTKEATSRMASSDSLQGGLPESSLMQSGLLGSGPTLFPPTYPSGEEYYDFIEPLGFSGPLFSDGPDPGTALNDERCNADGEAKLQDDIESKKWSDHWHLRAEAAPFPLNAVFFELYEIEMTIQNIWNILLLRCEFQDALVDAAEIEAAYENSKIISSQLVDIQDTLDYAVELRRVHLQVIELKEKRTFLISATESGQPVADVEFMAVQVSGRKDPISFADVTANTTMQMVQQGIYMVEIDLPKGLKADADIFAFQVRHTNDVLYHYGFTLFDRNDKNNLDMG